MEHNGQTQIQSGIAFTLFGVGIAWLFPKGPGELAGVLMVLFALGLWFRVRALDHENAMENIVYVRPMMFEGPLPDGTRQYFVKHRGRKPLTNVRISMLDAVHGEQQELRHIPEVGPMVVFGAEHIFGWRHIKPLPPGQAAEFFIQIRSTQLNIFEHLLVDGTEFYLTLDEAEKSKSGADIQTPLRAIWSRNYSGPKPPSSFAKRGRRGVPIPIPP